MAIVLLLLVMHDGLPARLGNIKNDNLGLWT
jgi:hypothetical protein